MTTLTPQEIHEGVLDRYSAIATSVADNDAAGCCDDGVCCDTSELYLTDTAWLPESVTNLSLGCGDPITLAGLQPGETVLDLGSGAGIDCFMAARAVGEAGQVIGVDMTPAMLAKAERNKIRMGAANVDFRQGQIEALPVADSTVDVVISNCVINLSPDKPAVFRESFRVLHPGGRLAVSDMVTIGRFTPRERADVSAWAGCISGAEDVADYVGALRDAGFTDISVRDKGAPDVELAGHAPDDGPPRLFSARITAVRPANS